jgi:glyceraldehyde 3-phosphate dehydrogenase
MGVDVVMECTGLFVERDKAAMHLTAGAKKVLISAPGKGDDLTVVYGVNQDMIDPDKHEVVSNASCTTNCLAPMVKPLNEKIGVERGLMTTIHSYTNDQVLIDVYHKDIRRARSATQSQIPTATGAAAAVGKVLPSLNGKLDGFAVRVPTTNVSFVDLTFQASRSTSADEINDVLKEASEGQLKGILGYNNEPLVSHDFNHDSRSSIYEEPLTRMIEGDFVKVTAWYDNEWGFSNRMIDTAQALMGGK